MSKKAIFSKYSMRLARTLGVVLIFSLPSNVHPGFGAQFATTATVTGQIEDLSKAVVPAVLVTIVQTEQARTWTATTDGEGRFRFTHLPSGTYELRAEKTGFQPKAVKLALHVGEIADIPLMLPLATIAEEIQVEDLPAPIEVARTQVAETIVPQEVDSLPLNGRNYLDLALLAPGVSRTNTGSNQRFAETSAVPGTGISIAGQRNLNNGFLVDGVSATDDAAGLAGTFYSQEVVREFQVVSSGANVEFGRGSSGTINIVTKSGSNKWHGRAYGFFRNQRFDARHPLATRKDPLTQEQYGSSFSGPIVRDRLFFYTNFEQTRQNSAGFVTIAPSNVAAINSILAQFNFQGPHISTGEFPTSLKSTNYFVRADHQLNAAHHLAVRYNLYDVSSSNARTAGGLNDVSRGSSLDARDQTIQVTESSTLSNRTINEARFQFTRSRLAAPVTDLIGPAINIFGIASFGTATFSPTARSLDVYEVNDVLSTQRGSHFVKAGLDLIYNRVNINFPGSLQGVYNFSSVENLSRGRFINFQQAFGVAEQFQSNPNLGVFAQDEWRAGRGITLNAGLRYDVQWLPDPIKTDTNNISPRVGIAFAPGNHKTVIRASYGLFYDRIPLRATSNALQRDGVKYKVAVLSFGQAGAPQFPQTRATFPDGVLTSITTIDPHIAQGYAQQASIEIQRQLGNSASLSVGYQHLRGERIILSRNVNVPTLTAADAARLGIPNLGRPNRRFANISRFESSGDSYYDGLSVSFEKRASRWSSLRVSYTLSKTIDNAGNFFFSSPQDNFDLRGERGLSDNDQRQRLSVSGSLFSPLTAGRSLLRRAIGNTSLSYIFSYGSALPFNLQAGTDLNHDTNVNDRPAGVGRNTGRGFNSATFDLRLSRRFRLTERVSMEAIAEGFNLFNRTNFQLPNRTFGTNAAPLPGFGQPTAAGDPRQIQFGLRISL